MHEIRMSNFAVKLNNWQFMVLFFFCLSGLGFAASVAMIAVDIIRWSLQ